MNHTLADSQQLRFATSEILPGYQPEPRCELPASAELSGISDRGDECAGGQWPDTGDVFEPLAEHIVSMPKLNLTFQRLHPIIQRPQMVKQSQYQFAKSSW